MRTRVLAAAVGLAVLACGTQAWSAGPEPSPDAVLARLGLAGGAADDQAGFPIVGHFTLYEFGVGGSCPSPASVALQQVPPTAPLPELREAGYATSRVSFDGHSENGKPSSFGVAYDHMTQDGFFYAAVVTYAGAGSFACHVEEQGWGISFVFNQVELFGEAGLAPLPPPP